MRFRIENEMREGKYWKEVKRRICKLRKGERESCEHMWEKYREWRERRVGRWQEECRILGGVRKGKNG